MIVQHSFYQHEPGISRRTAIGAALLGLAGSGTTLVAGCAQNEDSQEVVTETPVLDTQVVAPEKPLLYLYPETAMDLSVRLDYDGELTHLYPEAPSEGGRVEWEVTANPDGVLTDSSGRSYPYLFWEGRSRLALSQDAGAVVAAPDANRFLEDLAAATGLNDFEAADLITYWAPRIAAREQTLVTVATEQYTAMARYTLTDAAGQEITPDTVIRLYLVIGDAPSSPVYEQDLPTPPRRTGFTLVEWGGSEL